MYLNAGETTHNLFAISIHVRDCSCSIVDTPISFLYGEQGGARQLLEHCLEKKNRT